METSTSARALVRVVELVIVFEAGKAEVTPLEWHRGMTALNALEEASKKPHGSSFRATGDDPTAFVTEIDGQANDATGNWLSSFNREMPTIGSGAFPLRPSDIVRWEFVPCDPKAS